MAGHGAPDLVPEPAAHLGGAHVVAQPGVAGAGPADQADVGGVALVAAAGVGDALQRHPQGGAGGAGQRSGIPGSRARGGAGPGLGVVQGRRRGRARGGGPGQGARGQHLRQGPAGPGLQHAHGGRRQAAGQQGRPVADHLGDARGAAGDRHPGRTGQDHGRYQLAERLQVVPHGRTGREPQQHFAGPVRGGEPAVGGVVAYPFGFRGRQGRQPGQRQLGLQPLPEHPGQQLGLGQGVRTGDHQHAAGPEPVGDGDAGLQQVGGGPAAHAPDPHPVRAGGLQADAGEVGGHVRAQVAAGIAHLVQQLLAHGGAADQAAAARVLGEDAAAVRVHLGDGQAHIHEAGDLGPVGEVAASGLGPAFQQVADDDAAGQGVIVRGPPAEGVDQRAQGQAGVGDPAAEHDVRVVAQGLGHRGGAEVGVGGQGLAAPGQERRPGLQVAQIGAGGQQLVQARGERVALHQGDAQIQAPGPGRRRQGLGAGLGVDPAGVGDDADLPVQELGQERGHLGDEVPGVAGRRVPRPLLLQDAHGHFGQVVDDDVVQGQRAAHLAAQGPGVVPPVAAGVGDADQAGAGHGRAHSRSTPRRLSATGADRAQARDAARTARVARGSSTPSSHSRAEA